MTTSEKSLADFLPKTAEEMTALIRDQDRRWKNQMSCESPIEHDFLHCFYKVKADEVSLAGQQFCNTRTGRYRLDFVISVGHRRIGFECDGKDFHDANCDKLRDRAILEAGFVDSIYRAPGKSLHFFTYEALDLLRIAEPALFGEKGRELLDAVLDDGSNRHDSWSTEYALRTLYRPQFEGDEGYDPEEVTYKQSQFVLLKWTQIVRSSRTK